MSPTPPSGDSRADQLARARNYVEDARRGRIGRLPPEPRLAEELGVTRARLRVLLKQLQSEGLIWRHVGKGTFVGERSLAQHLGSLPDVLSPLEAFEARMLIEPPLAALAAMRATMREIEEMHACLAASREIHTFPEWAIWDERLHRLIAKSAHNPLLLAVYDTVRESAPSGMRNRLHDVFAAAPRAETNEQHFGFIEAIARRNPISAEQLMKAHLLSVRVALFGEL